ncbi:MAG: septal ring lytic transglycosylase RlpA family protein [Deltaproteobacteria bacterium]|nr:septal ring lytic transglycosylase RlpA family protein [Deltaproteobacteria bacterium]
MKHFRLLYKMAPKRLICISTCVLILTAMFWGCGTTSAPPPKAGYPKPYRIGNDWYQPIPDARGFAEQGVASWYGPDFHGKPTASGEIYDMFAMTAAHKTLPLGTRVRVTRKDDGRSVLVRINDRGPFVSGRIIDLSKAAATELGLVADGTAPVVMEAVAAPGGTSPDKVNVYYVGKFSIQVGSFKDPANAERMKSGLSEKYNDVHVVTAEVGGETFHRVRVGRSHTLDKAREFERVVHKKGYPQAFIVAE